MLTIALRNRITKTVTWPKTTSSKERVVIRVMVSLFLLDMIGTTFLVKTWFFSDVSSYAVAMAASIVPGESTGQFISDLNSAGLNSFMSRKIKRAPFSVEGTLIGVNGKDNMEVFEYGDHDTAMKDEAMLVAKYAASTVPNTWKDITHIYVRDNLLIYYMGTDPDILLALDQNPEFSLGAAPVALTNGSK